jgi:hypothetical protein
MLRQTTAMSKFICITFGPRNDEPNMFWNERTFWDTQRSAERWGTQSLPIAGCFGFVIIEEGEDFWDVVDELGAPAHAVSISCDRLGTFSVQPAPQLQLV